MAGVIAAVVKRLWLVPVAASLPVTVTAGYVLGAWGLGVLVIGWGTGMAVGGTIGYVQIMLRLSDIYADVALVRRRIVNNVATPPHNRDIGDSP